MRKKERELTNEEIFKLFEHNYIDIKQHYRLLSHKFASESAKYSGLTVTFEGNSRVRRYEYPLPDEENGPIDSFFNALGTIGVTDTNSPPTTSIPFQKARIQRL